MDYENKTHRKFIAQFKQDSMGALSYIEYLEGRLDSSLHEIVKLESDKSVSGRQVRDLERHISGSAPCEEENSKLITIDDVLKLLQSETNKYESLADMGRKNGVGGKHIRRVLDGTRKPGAKIFEILKVEKVTRYVATG
jgi:hypothetical protein